MTNEYFGTTASALDHYFGNYVGIVRLWLLARDTTQDYEARRRTFIDGLEKSIRENLPEYGGVTQQHLRQMIQLAESGEWADIETVKTLFRTYHQIRHMPFDEQKLFEKE